MESYILSETKKLDPKEIKRRKILSNRLKLSKLSVKEAKAKSNRAAKLQAARIAKLQAARTAISKKEKEKAAQQARIEAHKANLDKRNLISSISKFVNKQLKDPSFKKGADGKWPIDILTSDDASFYNDNKKQIDEYLEYELRKRAAIAAQKKDEEDKAKEIKSKENAAKVKAAVDAAIAKKVEAEKQKQQQSQAQAAIVDLPPITYS